MTIKLKKGKKSHPSGRQNALSDLTGSAWAQSSKSVMQYDDTRTEKQRKHGASFPQSLAEHQILIYTKKAETVLDPFVGIGTTLDAAAATGRNGIGIELNPEFVELAKKDLKQIEKKTKTEQRIICDDVRNIRKYLESDSVNFILTSPPYANMLKKVQKKFLYKWKSARDRFGFTPINNTQPYSNDPRDIGNLPYNECLDALEQVFSDTLEILKDDSYAVWVVKDFRDLENGIPYVNFHEDIIERAEKSGWTLWDIRIYDQTRFRPLIILGIPSRNFYLNIGHSYMLVFKKSKTKK